MIPPEAWVLWVVFVSASLFLAKQLTREGEGEEE